MLFIQQQALMIKNNNLILTRRRLMLHSLPSVLSFVFNKNENKDKHWLLNYINVWYFIQLSVVNIRCTPSKNCR